MKVVRKGETMRDILELVSTEFVLLADDLDIVTNWTNIERGVSRVTLRRSHKKLKRWSQDQAPQLWLDGCVCSGRGSEEL